MVFINFSWLRLLIDQMHIAQRVRKAADDEINDRSTQVLVSLIETRVDHQARAGEPDARCLVGRPGGQFFDDVERLAVDNSDLVKRMEQAE